MVTVGKGRFEIKIHNLLNSMDAAEKAFLETRFVAPVLPGGQVRVRIAGVVCTLRVTGRPDPGWAILQPLSLDRARVIGQPGLRQIGNYLDLFPALRLLLLARTGRAWLAVPAHRGDHRFHIDGPVPVYLVTGAHPFQRIVARYDGANFWFQELDRRRNPAIAAYLRDALDAWTPPAELRRPTLTVEERASYDIAYRAVEAAQRDRVEARLATALEHAGANLASYIEQEGAYSVTFTLDGRQHRSIVRQDDLTVLASGICLDGWDQDFDLQSLVGVLREWAQGR